MMIFVSCKSPSNVPQFCQVSSPLGREGGWCSGKMKTITENVQPDPQPTIKEFEK